ncbi:hypothetical protein AJ88_46900 [Mesorhizobium amorphae CCBAU 01583]|nr:hypothetical protein AJ88_46900 [Mesorhizobium amorphae CCBAU 01583]
MSWSTSRLTRLRSSCWVQFREMKAGLTTTMPNLEFAIPRSICCEMLSPELEGKLVVPHSDTKLA